MFTFWSTKITVQYQNIWHLFRFSMPVNEYKLKIQFENSSKYIIFGQPLHLGTSCCAHAHERLGMKGRVEREQELLWPFFARRMCPFFARKQGYLMDWTAFLRLWFNQSRHTFLIGSLTKLCAALCKRKEYMFYIINQQTKFSRSKSEGNHFDITI